MWNYSILNWANGKNTRRRKQVRGQIAVVDVLEQRLVLAVPGPVTVTGVDFSDGTIGTLEINWESQDEADNYEYWISSSNLFKAQGGVTTATQFTDQDANTNVGRGGYKYRIWLRASNEDGAGPWGASFDWVNPGEQPTEQPVSEIHIGLQTGLTKYYTKSQRVAVNWVRIGGAQEYEVWISKDGQRVGDLRRVSSDSGTSAFGEDLGEGIYQIWVRAKNGLGVGPWSEPFTVATGFQPEVTGPSGNGLPPRPEITWSAGAENVDYELWLTHEDSSTVTRYKDVVATLFTPNADLTAGVYSAWVRQVSETNIDMPWSARYRFEVGTDTRPGVPVLTGTNNTLSDTVEDFRGIFQWTAAANAVSYEFYIGDPRGGFAEYLKDVTVTDHVTIPLFPNPYNTYRAWVRALGSDGTFSDWSGRVEIQVSALGKVFVH